MKPKTHSLRHFTLALLMLGAFALGAFCFSNSSPKAAYALPPGSMGNMMVSSVQTPNGQTTTITVIDSENERMMIYRLNGGNLTLLTVRNLSFDRRFPYQYQPKGKTQTPTVKELEKAFKKRS